MNRILEIATFEDQVALEEWLEEVLGASWQHELERAILNFHLEESEGWDGSIELVHLWGYIRADKDGELEEAFAMGANIDVEYQLDTSTAEDGTPVVYVKKLTFKFYSPYTEEELLDQLGRERDEELEVERYIEQSYFEENKINKD